MKNLLEFLILYANHATELENIVLSKIRSILAYKSQTWNAVKCVPQPPTSSPTSRLPMA